MDLVQKQLKKSKKGKEGYSSISLRKSPVFRRTPDGWSKYFYLIKLEGELEDTKFVTKDDFELLAVIGRGAAGKVMQVSELFCITYGLGTQKGLRYVKSFDNVTGEIFAMKVIKKATVIARAQVEHCKVEQIDVISEILG